MDESESLRGKFLVANGSLYAPTFRQTVILMADHDDNGALGFVVNRPASMVVDHSSSLAGVSVLDETVYSGGPVQEDAITVIAEFEDPADAPHLIFDTVGFPSLEEPAGLTGIKRARVFSGYSGWGPGQLERELEEGSWIVAPPAVDLVFDVPPEEKWRETLQRMGGRFALLATMPFDPSRN